MDKRSFDKFRTLIYDVAGIKLAEGKLALVRARIAKRLQALGLETSEEYFAYIKADKSRGEIVNLLDVITTNVTSFFREKEHFDVLTDVFIKRLQSGQKKFRIWSAGCSSGQEPYTLTMTFLEALNKAGKKPSSVDLKILGTDISTKVLAMADRGEYSAKKVDGIPISFLTKYFDRTIDSNREKSYRVKQEMRRLVTFKRLNLSQPPFPMKGPMDWIFCRNTMIYFDNKVRMNLVSDFERLQKPDSILFIGHSESLAGFESRYTAIKPSIYKRTSNSMNKAS